MNNTSTSSLNHRDLFRDKHVAQAGLLRMLYGKDLLFFHVRLRSPVDVLHPSKAKLRMKP